MFALSAAFIQVVIILTKEIRFVEEFTDIGKYFNMPVKSCSSGMRARLTFGVSLAFDFDYYMLD